MSRALRKLGVKMIMVPRESVDLAWRRCRGIVVAAMGQEHNQLRNAVVAAYLQGAADALDLIEKDAAQPPPGSAGVTPPTPSHAPPSCP